MLLLKKNSNIRTLTELPVLGESWKVANLLLFSDKLAENFFKLL